jgi:hypothetical protein
MPTHRADLIRLVSVVFLSLITTGCEAIGTIFEAGVWVGVVLMVLILGVVGFVVAKVRRS